MSALGLANSKEPLSSRQKNALVRTSTCVARKFATWRVSVDRHRGLPFLLLLPLHFCHFVSLLGGLPLPCPRLRSSCISRSRPSPESYPSSKAECTSRGRQCRSCRSSLHFCFLPAVHFCETAHLVLEKIRPTDHRHSVGCNRTLVVVLIDLLRNLPILC